MTYPPNAPMPPAAPTPVPAGKAAPTGWLGVLAGVLGLLALVLPWYDPKFSKAIPGASINANPYHAWSGFFILVIGPIALIAFAVLWVQALTGRTNSRFAGSADPHRSLAVQSIGVGVLALVVALLSYPLVKSHYKDWRQAASFAKAHGSSLSRNMQPGLWLLVLGGALMVLAGILGLATRRSVPQFPMQ
jgi:hypothetical protein